MTTKSAGRRWLRRLAVGFGIGVGLFAGTVVLVGYRLSSRPFKGPRSAHFDGERFVNQREVPHGGFGDILRWQWSREPGPWQRRTTPALPPPPATVARGRLRVTFVNHATTLLQMTASTS